MRKLLRLFLKYYAVFLFLLLEGIAVSLIVSQNHYHKAVFINASSGVIGYVSEKWSNITDYFALKKENKKLLEENLRLHRRLQEEQQAGQKAYNTQYMTAKVVNASVFRQKNYFTINKGKKQGVQVQMAIAGPEGVIGLVENTSQHYATVIPIINTRFHLSAKIKRNDYFGSLSWDGRSYKYAQLDDIPAYVDVFEDDTVTTTGFGSSFPEGEIVGHISNAEKADNSAFWNIDVRLATDFKNIQSVYILNLPLSEEQEKLEKTQ